ncbi:MAG TPA: hypothetical protein VKA19_00190 [Alphaproteobacteria bacterium]|nr:hypothetical protein [Alphaproteobacteria bacterium]
MNKLFFAAGLAAAFLTTGPALADDWHSVEVFSGFDYSSGKYGETSNTDILYFPLTVKYETGLWTLRATSAYIHIRGPANVVGGGTGQTFVANINPVGDVSREGPGDVLLGLTYSIDKFWDRGLSIDLTGKVKLPTASAAKGLGTGKTDFTGQIDVTQTWGRITPFATIAYRVIGRPAAYRLHNAWNGSVGLQYRISRKVGAGLSFDYRQSASDLSADPQELFGYVTIAVGPKWSLDLYGIAGLSDGSPGAAGGMQITFRSH